MASNFFGNLFRITTFGESHGPSIGVVIDGCPAGIAITKEEIELELVRRRPGNSPYTSPRKESDMVHLLSGVYQGMTTGAPIALLIHNENTDSAPYAKIKELYRPGHANFSYLKKYGIFDERGGGRASARETVARVAAGAVAKKLLAAFDISCAAFVLQIKDIGFALTKEHTLFSLKEAANRSPIFCPDPNAEKEMIVALEEAIALKDSLGATLGCIAHLPAGLGEPVYGKLPALLAFAMLSIPATKGFEIGEGFETTKMRGSEHTDGFTLNEDNEITPLTNHAGGTLGGISTGAPLLFRVAFKPTSSIQRSFATVTMQKERACFTLPKEAKHDPCVGIRAVPIVEAMTALVLADLILLNRSAKI